MSLDVEATYEDGVLKPARPLPLREHQTVRVTVHTSSADDAGVIPCTDPRLIEWAALDPDLDFPPPPEEP